MRRISTPVPANEMERLSYLHNLGCLDTPRNAKIDRITAMAARIFNVHTAVVTLIDHDRQWLKSPGAWATSNSSREDSFCAHTIMKDEVLICEDTFRDPRFCQKPTVLGPLHIRFYAGAPLIAEEGIRLGALCLIHTKPREFSSNEQATLRDMAVMVMDELKRESEMAGVSKLPEVVHH